MTSPSTRVPVTEASLYLGIAVSTLNKRRCAGGGPAYIKLGRRVVYDVADLDSFIAQGRRDSTSSDGGH
jgi:hypothetical protein